MYPQIMRTSLLFAALPRLLSGCLPGVKGNGRARREFLTAQLLGLGGLTCKGHR